MDTLPESVQQTLDDHCARGDELAEDEQYDAALQEYFAAEALIPEPKDQWEASTWVYSAIGDAFYFKQDYESCLNAFHRAVVAPDGLGNPFIHLRLGQCQYELGNLPKAADELARAYMGAGDEIFEDDDPKYFEFLKTKIEID